MEGLHPLTLVKVYIGLHKETKPLASSQVLLHGFENLFGMELPWSKVLEFLGHLSLPMVIMFRPFS